MLGIGWKPFDRASEDRIVQAIQEAEAGTSAEIKVHVDKWCKTDPLFKAGNIFKHLGLHQTKGRNAVLVYLALKEHKFAIIGDIKANELLTDGYWDSLSQRMSQRISSENVAAAICDVVASLGKDLAKVFPPSQTDKNELSDDISYG